jgi:hypothetical protein
MYQAIVVPGSSHCFDSWSKRLASVGITIARQIKLTRLNSASNSKKYIFVTLSLCHFVTRLNGINGGINGVGDK